MFKDKLITLLNYCKWIYYLQNIIIHTAKHGEGTSTSDSRTCLKDSPGTDSATDSHLLLPKADNPNFLSPDALNYRRGNLTLLIGIENVD